MSRIPGRVALLSLLAAGCLAASSALAQSGRAYLAWDDCSAAGVSARSFACNSNAGSESIVMSFRPANATDSIHQLDAWLAIGDENFSVMPAWWSLLNTGCRPMSLRASVDFTSSSGTCADPWYGTGFASLSLTQFAIFDNQLRRLVVHATVGIPFAAAAPLDPGTEYYGVRFTLNHAKTVGSGACSGCEQPMCLSLYSYCSTTANPEAPVSRNLSPEPGYTGIVWNGGQRCSRLTPTSNRTWGALKSLYR